MSYEGRIIMSKQRNDSKSPNPQWIEDADIKQHAVADTESEPNRFHISGL